VKDSACTPLAGFDSFEYQFEDKRYCVYTAGAGAPVLLMHELPGMSPQCVVFARHLIESGFRVYLPLLFGHPNQSSNLINPLRICISREFRLFAGGKSSPVTEWLTALCGFLSRQNSGSRIGVIGMCLTGSYVFACMAEPSVAVAVTSQPALPLPITKSRRAQIGASPEQLDRARSREIPVLGLRFTSDRICPAERFVTLQQNLGSCWREIQVPPPPQNPKAHSVLTQEWIDHPTAQINAAVAEVIRFLGLQLLTGAATSQPTIKK
jgi:dienelactone hydrolase